MIGAEYFLFEVQRLLEEWLSFAVPALLVELERLGSLTGWLPPGFPLRQRNQS